jgi:outer membrane biosynthesis protein TonB
LSCALVSVACPRQSAVDRSPKEKVAHAAADSARAIDAGIEAPTDGAGRAAASAPLGAPNNFGTICDCPTSEYSNGSGRGRGIGGLGPVRAMPAAVTPDTPKVRGGLDREIIRRLVRPHLPELLSCYEPAVARRPRLAGQIEVEITIAPSGDVGSAVVRRSTVHDSSVVSCFVAAIRDWKFLHSLDGQKVIVPQRFTLTPPHGPRPRR